MLLIFTSTSATEIHRWGRRECHFFFDSFEVLGNAEMEKVLIQGWTVPAAIKPDKRLRDMPVENQVVTFD